MWQLSFRRCAWDLSPLRLYQQPPPPQPLISFYMPDLMHWYSVITEIRCGSEFYPSSIAIVTIACLSVYRLKLQPHVDNTWATCVWIVIWCSVAYDRKEGQNLSHFGNMCTFICFVLFRLCIFILICFVCTSVKTATEWQLNCNK